MIAEVRMGRQPSNKPFRPGVWLNESEIALVLRRLPKTSWLRADLIEKFKEAQEQAARQTAAWAAERDVKVLEP